MVNAGHEVACKVQEGAGGGHVWALRAVDTSSGRDHTAVSSPSRSYTSYKLPRLQSVAGVGGTGNLLSTKGAPSDNSVSIVVEGQNFGPADTPVQLLYGPDGSERALSARDCRVTNSHVQITCHPVPGVGGPLSFVASADGQESSIFDSDLSYTSPEINEVIVLLQQEVQQAQQAASLANTDPALAVEALALGMDASSTNALLSTHGVDTVYISGDSFGPGPASLPGSIVTACYGPASDPDRYCVSECSNLPTNPHAGVLCKA